MTTQIQVFILQTQATNAQSSNLSRLFGFNNTGDTSGSAALSLNVTHILAVPPTSDLDLNPDQIQYNTVKSALTNLSAIPDYVVFCLDTSIGNVSAETVYYTIKEAVKLNETGTQNWDVCYLCKWMDNCSVYKNVVPNIGESNAKIVQTLSPFGFQSVLFSPSGASKFRELLNTIGDFNKPLNLTLHDQISTDVYTAIAIVPNLLSFDPSMARPGSIDYVRTTECRDPTPIQTPFKSSNLSFFWFLIVVIVVITLICVSTRLGVLIDQRTLHQLSW